MAQTIAKIDFSELPSSVRGQIVFFLRQRANAQVLIGDNQLEITDKGKVIRYDDLDVLNVTLDGKPVQTKRTRMTVDELPADAQECFANLPVDSNNRDHTLSGNRVVTVFRDGSGFYMTSEMFVTIPAVKK